MDKDYRYKFNDDVSFSATFGEDDYFYVAGSTESDLNNQTNNGSYDIFVIKFDSEGNEIWTELYGTSNVDYSGEINYRSDGYLYLTGESDSRNTENSFDGFLKKLDTNGD